VIAVTVDVGQSEDDIKEAKERGEKLSDSYREIDAKEEFVRDYIFPLIKANGNYEGYVLGTAIARPLIAKHVVEVAREENEMRSHMDAQARVTTSSGLTPFSELLTLTWSHR